MKDWSEKGHGKVREFQGLSCVATMTPVISDWNILEMSDWGVLVTSDHGVPVTSDWGVLVINDRVS